MVQVIAAIAIIIALGLMINLAYDYKEFKSNDSNGIQDGVTDDQGFCEISLDNMVESRSDSGNKDIESLRSKIESFNNRNKFYKM